MARSQRALVTRPAGSTPGGIFPQHFFQRRSAPLGPKIVIGAGDFRVDRIWRERGDPLLHARGLGPFVQKAVSIGDLFGDVRIPRIDRQRFLEEIEIFIPPPLAAPDRGREITDVAVVRQSLARDRKLLQRLVVIRFHPIIVEAEREMALSQVRPQLQSLFRFRFDPGFALVDRIEPVINPRDRGGEPRMSQRERWVVLDRFAIKLLGHAVIFEQTIGIRFVRTRLEVEHVSVRVLGRLGFHADFFLGAQGGAQLRGNLRGEFALQTERIRQRAIVTIGPDMVIVARIDELHAHDHAIFSPAHTSFQHVDHAEGLRNLPQIIFAAPRYGITDVRLITFKSWILARLVRMSS